MTIKNSFIDIDTGLWENAIVHNFNINRSYSVLEKINSIAHIDIVKTSKNKYAINFVIRDAASAYSLLDIITKAQENLMKYKTNARTSYFNFLKNERANRKFYQFWKHKSDEKLLQHVVNEYSWIGNKADITEYHHFINKELLTIIETLNLYKTLNAPKPVNINLSQRNFSLLLHFFNDESFNIL